MVNMQRTFHRKTPSEAPVCQRRTPFGLAYSTALVLFVCQPALGEPLAEQQTALERHYSDELESLAAWCDSKKLPDEARATRNWIVPHPPLTIVVRLADIQFPDVATTASDAPREWNQRFRHLRQAQAKRYFDLLQRAASEREFVLAYQLAHATLRENPDHEVARQLLGYKRRDGQWLTAYESYKVKSQQIWDERFGWLDKKNLPRYESGERYFRGRWLSADEDERLHRDINRGWEIATEHYQVRTNHSLGEGVRLAARLEEFYGVWRQLFVRYVMSEAELARLFREGAPANRTPRRHQVTYFRNRNEYLAALGGEHPAIQATSGYYDGTKRTAYFFVPEPNDGKGEQAEQAEPDDSTLYHEATHQLFSELKQVNDVGRDANFWVVEGIACFMESFRRGERLVTLGGGKAIRLENARVWLLEERKYLPLAELCRMGMDDLQRHPEIKMIYSEASGMTYYLLFADGGRYRQALVDYLSSVYANRAGPVTLAELTGTSYSQHDEQYHQFLKQLP